MLDVLDNVVDWLGAGQRIALATVIATSRSAPRDRGATMVIHPDGHVIGSVSGGCVESAVVGLAEEVLADGRTRRATYGFSDGEALEVGLTCGGTIEVLIRAVDASTLDAGWLQRAVSEDRAVGMATIVADPEHPEHEGHTLLASTDEVLAPHLTAATARSIAEQVRGSLESEHHDLRRILCRERSGEDLTVFIESFVPAPKLYIVGAIDFAGALATVGRFLGYHVTVCDARERFARAVRFPDAHEVVHAWPHRLLSSVPITHSTAVCVLTHDARFDVPTLAAVLGSDARYVGAMGSRRTHEDRLRRLRDHGVPEEHLSRLRSPIGLDLGGRTPQEVAMSIGAELVLSRHGGSGAPLSLAEGPIHRPVPAG